MILVTGGAGFIGSNFVLDWLACTEESIVNLDALTYAGNLQNLVAVEGDPRYTFVRGDICDRSQIGRLLASHRPRAIVHFAAESHVDRSIHDPGAFVRTNVDGTFNLLEATREYLKNLNVAERNEFRFLHVSTDEVYGSLGPLDPPFSENTPYAPSSPYAASKAASDHLVRAWHLTYGVPTLTTNCSNNYGPFQFPEKLIPLMVLNAIAGSALPVYGDGENVRDWLYVGDHCAAVREVLAKGRVGEVYNVGGKNEMKNIEVVSTVCAILDELRPKRSGHYAEQITFVRDRPGHDHRYAIDTQKIQRELGWISAEAFESGIRKTVEWYLEAGNWVENVRTGSYQKWVEQRYAVATAEQRCT